MYSLLLCMIGCGGILTPVPLGLGALEICTEEFNPPLRRLPRWGWGQKIAFCGATGDRPPHHYGPAGKHSAS